MSWASRYIFTTGQHVTAAALNDAFGGSALTGAGNLLRHYGWHQDVRTIICENTQVDSTVDEDWHDGTLELKFRKIHTDTKLLCLWYVGGLVESTNNDIFYGVRVATTPGGSGTTYGLTQPQEILVNDIWHYTAGGVDISSLAANTYYVRMRARVSLASPPVETKSDMGFGTLHIIEHN